MTENKEIIVSSRNKALMKQPSDYAVSVFISKNRTRGYITGYTQKETILNAPVWQHRQNGMIHPCHAIDHELIEDIRKYGGHLENKI